MTHAARLRSEANEAPRSEKGLQIGRDGWEMMRLKKIAISMFACTESVHAYPLSKDRRTSLKRRQLGDGSDEQSRTCITKARELVPSQCVQAWSKLRWKGRNRSPFLLRLSRGSEVRSVLGAVLW